MAGECDTSAETPVVITLTGGTEDAITVVATGWPLSLAAWSDDDVFGCVAGFRRFVAGPFFALLGRRGMVLIG